MISTTVIHALEIRDINQIGGSSLFKKIKEP
jgi:hypothetical protein